MQSIGERLEEARKRRGISVREASEATKIRGDFLLSFENNQFEVGLPELYVRGFLRNYAGFLKVDPDKIVTDFNAAVIAESKAARKETRELFGRMELPERPRPPAEGPAAAGPRHRAEDTAETAREPVGPDLAMYVKIGAIIVAGVASILVIVLLVQWVVRAGGSPGEESAGSAIESPAQAPAETITLVALDTVHATVTQLTDGRVVFDGGLARGERRPVDVRGRVRISYDRGANLQIEWQGQRYRMNTAGMASTFPPE